MRLTKILLGAICLCYLFSGVVEAVAPMPTEFRMSKSTLKLGDTLENVFKALGRPIVVTANGQNNCWRDRIDLYSPEIIVKAPPGSKKSGVFGIIIDRQQGITTPEGIGIGSTKEAVIEQYGKTHEYIDHNRDTVMCYGGGTAKKKGKITPKPFFRLRIDAKTQKVTYMIIEQPQSL
ncbi:MAG: hypothetical protein IJ849_04180 [Selenomonadaceae bacterium]|nr:hypothetical protein [Selenomonadaceae bacterium]